ncbi:hypothetical protein GCM10010423_64720 [Streptomyces levis]|uniref:Uncharacterized protein n=1 Tax=Streptomyces levis TaxID=285566 RepID=A0ABN3P2F6_9ACTN
MAEIRRDAAPMSENQGAMGEPPLEDFYNPNLPEELRRLSRRFYDLAEHMVTTTPVSAQRAQCLWDLLRAKDCAVRAWRYRNARTGE